MRLTRALRGKQRVGQTLPAWFRRVCKPAVDGWKAREDGVKTEWQNPVQKLVGAEAVRCSVLLCTMIRCGSGTGIARVMDEFPAR